MTENPSVPSPPGLPQLPSNATSTPTPEEAQDTSGEIRCICEYTDDDGYTICCDKCETWQHLVCMQLREDNVPKQYQCANCSPRPVDARKAKELQQRRRRDEEQDRDTKANTNTTTNNSKRKRTSGASHRKKETQSNGSNGISSKTVQNTEKTAPKLPSPRESQAPTSRKRTQRALHSVSSTTNNASSSGQISSANSPHPDRNGDAESDTDFEKFKYDYLDISNESDRYESEEVEAYLLKEALTAPRGSIPEERLRHSNMNDFYVALPKTSVRSLDDSSKTYSDKQRWCLVLDSPCAKGRPVALFRGQVGFQEAYKKLPTNQYAQWHHPKPHVVFHPDFSIFVDARGCGSQARFVRRSCRPNVGVNTVVLDGSKVRFGLYATESLKAGTELTVGWDWGTSKYLQHLAEEDFDFSKMTTDEIRQAALWVHNLLDKVGDCACAGGPECLLIRTKKAGGIETSTVKPPTTNGNNRKQKVKRNSSAEPNGSKEPTPDRHNTMHDDDGDDSQAGSTATKVKSRSRDLTPSLAQETAVEHGIMTGREARKFKDVLSRIEKQQQEDSHPQSSKRRKRNSTVSGPICISSTSPVTDNLKVPEKHRKKTKDRSRGQTPHFHEVSVTDASTGRRASHSSNSSEEHHKAHGLSSPTADSSGSSVVQRKVVSKDAKLMYVDSCIQTEIDDDLPWWRQPTQSKPRREPRLPLRKRLMQSLLRDREEAAASSSPFEKKRKHDAISDCSVGSPPKIPKLDPEAVDIQIAPNAPGPPPIVAISAPPETPHVESMSPGSASGPPLQELFSDYNAPPVPAGAAAPMKPPNVPSKGQQPPLTNGSKGLGLHLHLPPSSILASNPTELTLSVGTTPLFSPSVASALGGVGAAPSPTRTKKLSLGDYSKRKHKSTDTVMEKKEEEKPSIKVSADPIPTKSLPFLDGQRKLADILAPPVEKLTSQPTPPSSLDPPIGAERAANQWSVR